jgi:hypothetical protein
LQEGLIEPSTSPYGCPIIFVEKTGQPGKLRRCLDTRALNAQTIPIRTLIPRQDCCSIGSMEAMPHPVGFTSWTYQLHRSLTQSRSQSPLARTEPKPVNAHSHRARAKQCSLAHSRSQSMLTHTEPEPITAHSHRAGANQCSLVQRHGARNQSSAKPTEAREAQQTTRKRTRNHRANLRLRTGTVCSLALPRTVHTAPSPERQTIGSPRLTKSHARTSPRYCNVVIRDLRLSQHDDSGVAMLTDSAGAAAHPSRREHR